MSPLYLTVGLDLSFCNQNTFAGGQLTVRGPVTVLIAVKALFFHGLVEEFVSEV